MSFFNEEQIQQLAPDTASIKAGKDLSNERKWLNFQSNERVYWGEVQGSGKDPYRTQIDRQNIAFKCSCPSRKFPCKHGLGLLFLIANKNGSIPTVATEPAWVSEWMNKRIEKTEVAATKEKEAESDPEKIEKKAKDKEKRQNERLLKVQAGIAELDLWLRDMVRTGFLSLPEKDNKYFEKMVARLVDSQATGLANMVKAFTKLNFYSGTSWQLEALEIAANIHLQIEAYNNLDNLPALVQEEIKSRVGFNIQQKELLENASAETVEDDWLVIGRRTSLEDDITMQRNWLYGLGSKKYALILNFAFKSSAIETPIFPGTIAKATLLFYPSNLPYRAIIKQFKESIPFRAQPLEALATLELAQDKYAAVLSQNPWVDEQPLLVENLSPAFHNGGWLLKDMEGNSMPVSGQMDANKIYQMLAISGGAPLDLFLLRQNNQTMLPIGIIQNANYQLI